MSRLCIWIRIGARRCSRRCATDAQVLITGTDAETFLPLAAVAAGYRTGDGRLMAIPGFAVRIAWDGSPVAAIYLEYSSTSWSFLPA